MDNVHDLDAWAGLVWRGVVVSRDVGRDDDRDDDAIPCSHAAEIPQSHRNGTASGLTHHTGGSWVLFCVDSFRNSHLPLGVALAAAAMHLPGLSRAVPSAIGVVVLFAGLLQFTGWKAKQLACCRQAAGCSSSIPASTGKALQQGLRFGFHCVQCCFGLMIILLIIGVMDLGMMAVVAAAITAERLAPARMPVAQITGALVALAGLFLIARAAI